MNQEKKFNRRTGIVVTLIAAISLYGGWYFLMKKQPASHTTVVEQPTAIEPQIVTLPSKPSLEEKQIPTVAQTQPPATIEASVPVTSPKPELPSLTNSDKFTLDQWLMLDTAAFEPNLIEDNILRRVAGFIDNLSIGVLMRSNGPFAFLSEPFPVAEVGNKIYLDPIGYQRYQPFAEMFSQIDTAALEQMFVLLEPLLEQAYQELGYPAGQLRNQLRLAIDQVLQAPDFEGPFELQGHSVNYEFVDSRIESSSDTQKLLIRMGPENARKIKSQLRHLQSALAE